MSTVMTAPTDQHDSVCMSTFASTKEHSDEGQPCPSETTTTDTTTPPWDPCTEERCDVVEEQHSFYTESKTTQSNHVSSTSPRLPTSTSTHMQALHRVGALPQ